MKIFTELIFFFIYFALSQGKSLDLRNVKEINTEKAKIFSLFSNIDILSIIASVSGSSNTKEINDQILMISSKLQSMISSLSSFVESSMPSARSFWTQLTRIKNVENNIEFINVLMKEIEQLKYLLQIINSEKHIDFEKIEAVPFTTFNIFTTETSTTTTTFTHQITPNSTKQKNKWSVELINRFRERINDFINQIMQIINLRKLKNCVECKIEGQPISSVSVTNIKETYNK